jgi:hypothetical protein
LQTCNVDVSEEQGSDRNEGEDDAHALIMSEFFAPPLLIASGKPSYI